MCSPNYDIICYVDTKTVAPAVNGSVDDATTPVVSNDVDADDDRWEQVRPRNRTVFNTAVGIMCSSTDITLQ